MDFLQSLRTMENAGLIMADRVQTGRLILKTFVEIKQKPLSLQLHAKARFKLIIVNRVQGLQLGLGLGLGQGIGLGLGIGLHKD